MKLLQLILLSAATAIALTGCIDATEPGSFVEAVGSLEQPLSGRIEMTIQDFHHHPNHIVARVGSTIHVTNRDDSGESLLSDDKSLNSGILGQGESANVPLTELGKFVFSSQPYPNATGTITVVP